LFLPGARWVRHYRGQSVRALSHPASAIPPREAEVTQTPETGEASRESDGMEWRAAAAEDYRLLFECSPQAMWVCDTATLRFLAVNETALRRYGYSREEFLKLTLADIRPGEDLPYLAPMLRHNPGDTRTYDNVRHLRKDGTILHVEVSSSPIPAYGPNARLVIATDISARRKAEEAHLRLATAVEQAAESIVISDASGTVLYVNPAFEKTSGYTRDDVIGRNLRILKSGEHDPPFYQQMWSTIAAGGVWSGHVTNRRRDGSRYREEMTISPIRDDRGQIVNYVAVKRDVTRELALEEQLRQAQKMEVIGQFAGGIAHDFNNILTIIQGNVALLLDSGRVFETELALVRDISDAAERAARLTRQLLVSSRKQELHASDVDLNQVVRNLEEMVVRLLGDTLELRCVYAPELPSIHADTSMLEQILLNLVLNARDSMKLDGCLTIATTDAIIADASALGNPDAPTGRYVCLCVRDTGCGIPPEDLDRIFEPFFTTKEVGRGTGLGLATVYGIVKQHRGWIEAESEVEVGSTFRVYLPAACTHAPAGRSVAFAVDLPRGHEGILVTEDEPALRALVGKLLERCGYTVWLAESGVATLQVWEMHRDEIELLITDIMLPGGMLGPELARRMQSENPDLKVLFTSGYGGDMATEGLVLVEGANLIRKPWLPRAFAQTVRDCLDRK
jgi:two-component system cell cycle sensor histidine kinase/response regulator CckA